jgi:hypothetical protein
MDGLFEALKANPRLSHGEALRMSMLRMIEFIKARMGSAAILGAVRRRWGTAKALRHSRAFKIL